MPDARIEASGDDFLAFKGLDAGSRKAVFSKSVSKN
jgi:hypothetical protein